MTAPPGPPRPASIRALWPVGALRVALVLASLVGSALVAPGLWRRIEDQTTLQGSPAPSGLREFGLIIAVVTVLFGLAYLAGWVFAARAALRGRRWGATVLALLSGYGVLSGAFSLVALTLTNALHRLTQQLVPGRPVVDYSLPTWFLVVSVLPAVTDLVVVVLMVVPSSRAWVRAVNPPRPPAPPVRPAGWYPPPGSPPPGYGPPGRRH